VPRAACADGALGAADPSSDCARFLAGSEKAQAQWRLEGEFARFEAQPWAGR
jgi:adenosine deaminase